MCKESGSKHLFVYNDSFMNVTRQIQNHMNGSMIQFANHMRRQNGAYGFVNYMTRHIGKYHIRINCISPGTVASHEDTKDENYYGAFQQNHKK